MKVVGEFIDKALKDRQDDEKLKKIKADVKEFCSKFLFYK